MDVHNIRCLLLQLAKLGTMLGSARHSLSLGLGSALALSPSCVQIHVRGRVFDTTFLLG